MAIDVTYEWRRRSNYLVIAYLILQSDQGSRDLLTRTVGVRVEPNFPEPLCSLLG